MNPSTESNPAKEPQIHPHDSKSSEGGGGGQAEYAPYPKLQPDDVAPVAETWTSGGGSGEAPRSGATAPPPTTDSNPYIQAGSAPPSTAKKSTDKVKDALGKWGKRAAEATKKAEDLAGNMWQHLKTGPSLTDAAVSRIAHSSKALAEGGYEKIFQNTFESVPEEKLLKYYACYLSTSAGPIGGVLYLSTAKLAFCSDNPISHKVNDQTQIFYKVVVPLNQLKAVNPTASQTNPAEKYIQVISVDNHEFWFMGFVTYDNAVKSLLKAVQGGHEAC